jgi:hypothetical protein
MGTKKMTSSVVVARSKADGLEYLAQDGGRDGWTDTSGTAQQFQNIREATRAAMRLPSTMRAFALPIHAQA